MSTVGDDFWTWNIGVNIYDYAVFELSGAQNVSPGVFDLSYYAIFLNNGGRNREFDSQKSWPADGDGFVSVAWDEISGLLM